MRSFAIEEPGSRTLCHPANNKYFWFDCIIQLVEQTKLLFYLSIKRMAACLNKEESKGLSFVASFVQILLVRILLVHIIFVFLLLDIGVIKYFCQTRNQILFYEPMYLDRRIIFLILKSGVYLINNWRCQIHPFPRHLDFSKMTQITMWGNKCADCFYQMKLLFIRTILPGLGKAISLSCFLTTLDWDLEW